MSLQDQMTVAADAARLSKRDIKNAKARALRAAKNAAVEMNAEMARDAVATAIKSPVMVSENAAPTTGKAVVVTAPTKPVKVTIKQMVLAVFYVDPKATLSTKQAIDAIQAAHPGTNESSIRVWISDFQKDGSVKLVKREGRQVILRAGKIGGRFSKGGGAS